MSSSNCCILTCIQISQEAGQVVWYSHLFQNFPQFVVIYTVEGFAIVNKVEIDVFLELSCFFDDPEDVGNLISGSSAFSKTSLNIWKFTVHVLLKPGLENLGKLFGNTLKRQTQICWTISVGLPEKLLSRWSLSNRNVASYSSEVWKTKTKVWAGLISSKTSLFDLLLAAFSLCPQVASPLCTGMLSISSSSKKDINHVKLEPHSYHLI